MRSAAAATMLGITLTIAGLSSCAAPHGPDYPTTPEPGVTPVFASDEEALAAAEEVYGEYLEAENRLGQGGWTDLSIIEPFVRGDALDSERETATDLSSKQYRQVGDIRFDSMSLQQLRDRGPGNVELTTYLCLDFTSADVVDSDGDSIVAESRSDRLALEVQFDDADGDLRISRSETWPGTNYC